MNDAIHKIQKEKKPRIVIGVARAYDHALLLSWLDSIGISLDRWITEFNYQTRTAILRGAPAGMVAAEVPFRNLTPVVGFAALTKILTDPAAEAIEARVMVHAFGDDNTAPDDADTELGNETARKLLSSTSSNGASAFYTAFYDLPEGNGTHEEMGLFMNADAGTPDDGTLWDRSLISITKLASQSLTIDYEDTFVNNA